MFEQHQIAERLLQHAEIYLVAAQLYCDEKVSDDFERLAYECQQIALKIQSEKLEGSFALGIRSPLSERTPYLRERLGADSLFWSVHVIVDVFPQEQLQQKRRAKNQWRRQPK